MLPPAMAAMSRSYRCCPGRHASGSGSMARSHAPDQSYWSGGRPEGAEDTLGRLEERLDHTWRPPSDCLADAAPACARQTPPAGWQTDSAAWRRSPATGTLAGRRERSCWPRILGWLRVTGFRQELQQRPGRGHRESPLLAMHALNRLVSGAQASETAAGRPRSRTCRSCRRHRPSPRRSQRAVPVRGGSRPTRRIQSRSSPQLDPHRVAGEPRGNKARAVPSTEPAHGGRSG